jgi:hypothetical protein
MKDEGQPPELRDRPKQFALGILRLFSAFPPRPHAQDTWQAIAARFIPQPSPLILHPVLISHPPIFARAGIEEGAFIADGELERQI